ncbi:RNA polymerase sigma factor [Longitalea arenae]|uniref:RNA polymerase sigma factor n=1 Tax=Longitalea arenae TaxID=2812558 RepID=UPI0019682DB7|nr:sigma-70 family RNA polymerase sigma factor [Longitalea arenae]
MLEQHELDLFNQRNSDVFTKVHNKYFKPILLLCYSILNDKANARDKTQDIFIELWESQQRFEGEMNIKAFLYVKARHMCIDELRKHIPHRRLLKWLAFGKHAENPQVVNEHECIEAILQIIKNLPPKKQYIIDETILKGRTYEEVGGDLGITGEAVRQQRKSAINEIKLQLLNTILTIVVIACG